MAFVATAIIAIFETQFDPDKFGSNYLVPFSSVTPEA
jgi:hypothetical protein